MTPDLRDDLLIALGLIESAIEDTPRHSLPWAALKVASERIRSVYDKTALAVLDNVVEFPGHSVKVG